MNATRALLDELMGNDRDLHPSEKKKKDLRFYDPEICKYYICSFCPHDLFTNTKSDLGPCSQLHDDNCKKEWQNYDKKYRYNFEIDFIRYLEKLINDLDRRIKRGYERLDHQDDDPQISVSSENKEKIENINQRCSEIVKQIEELGDEGRIDEANALMKKLDELNQEKETLLKSDVKAISTTQERRMKVCETCGVFLVIGDTEKRTVSHIEGKQHQGYDLIRKTLDEYYKKEEEKRRKERERRASRESERRSSRSGGDRRSSGDRDGERDKDRRSSRDPEDRRDRRRRRSRSASRERESKRHKSRSSEHNY
eukprot:TRINITY_DN1305_c0_g1_i1.p1 TRINITY_DN1305_c0_g1~~TRINITY_DN1305_c0_g1_i1.p1  ORF type:complete len:311 (-),score=44.34 TRINITY_DN1305_c0_g1_i1:55-987(-)